MSTYTVRLPKMSASMVRHFECMKTTAALERELFGSVVSSSVEDSLQKYRSWPMPMLPDPGQPSWI